MASIKSQSFKINNTTIPAVVKSFDVVETNLEEVKASFGSLSNARFNFVDNQYVEWKDPLVKCSSYATSPKSNALQIGKKFGEPVSPSVSFTSIAP